MKVQPTAECVSVAENTHTLRDFLSWDEGRGGGERTVGALKAALAGSDQGCLRRARSTPLAGSRTRTYAAMISPSHMRRTVALLGGASEGLAHVRGHAALFWGDNPPRKQPVPQAHVPEAIQGAVCVCVCVCARVGGCARRKLALASAHAA
eukprot:1868060-Rhodomonas_salina.1